MRIFLLLLLVSFSVSAQTSAKPENIVYTTVVDGISAYDGKIELSSNQVLNGSIGLKYDHDDNQVIPPVIALEIFIPGYPAQYIKGTKLDEELKKKISGLKKGDAVYIRPMIEKTTNDSKYQPTVAGANITLVD